MDIIQILVWALIGLIYAGYGYLTNKLGDWSTTFEVYRFVMTAIVGAIVGIVLSIMGIALTPDNVIMYLQMPLFAGLGVLYVVERALKIILAYFKTPQELIP